MSGDIRSKVIILLDLENILFSSFDRAGQRFSRKDFVVLILEAIREIARGYGPIGYEYAAIAIPSEERESLSGDFGWYKTKREITQVVFALIDLGVHVITVPRGPDAADFALCQIGESVLDDLYVNAIILATGDGNEPFLGFIDKAHKRKKKVCVVAYNRIPKLVKECHVDEVLLVNKINTQLINSREVDIFTDTLSSMLSCSDMGDVNKEEGRSFSSSTFPLDEYKTFLEQLNTEGSIIDRAMLLKCLDAVRILEEECLRSPKGSRFSVSYLEKKLMKKMKDCLPGIALREVRQILSLLLEHTDLFSRSNVYTYSSNNQFEKQLEIHRERLGL